MLQIAEYYHHCSGALPQPHACRCRRHAASATAATCWQKHRRGIAACANRHQHDTADSGAEPAWPKLQVLLDRVTDAQASVAGSRQAADNATEPATAASAPLHQHAESGSSSWQQVAVAPAAPLQQPPPAPPDSLLTSTSGFVWALVVLLSIRLSRRHTEQAAFDLRSQVLVVSAPPHDMAMHPTVYGHVACCMVIIIHFRQLNALAPLFLQDVSMEALINDQQLFKARREYEQKEATAKAAEAAERCAITSRGWIVSIRSGQFWQLSNVKCCFMRVMPRTQLRLVPCRLAKAQEEATAREAERVRREQQRAAEAAEAKRRSDEAAAVRQVSHNK
jgi:hypothetical protein